MSFSTIERNTKYKYFAVNGFQYRTDGKSVQGKDGSSWNTTYSLPIILAARAASKTQEIPCNCDTPNLRECELHGPRQ